MKILVFTTVYPNEVQPNLGIFVKQRMSRVARSVDLKVVAPVPWFPFAGIFKEKYRVRPSFLELQDGVEVFHPRFCLIPKFCKWMDGLLLFCSTVWTIRKIRKEFQFDIIDAHFVYPDGFAGVLLGKYFKVPVTITLRGTINRLIDKKIIRVFVKWALKKATKILSVSQYLADLAISKTPQASSSKFITVPNGVDITKFKPIEKKTARKRLNIDTGLQVLVSVGGLVERKGHHRVLNILPDLIKEIPNLLYIIVGGGGVEGDMKEELKRLVEQMHIEKHVRFSGEIPHAEVSVYLSAANIFVLPTRFEGWPNVFFEAMSCGLPVVTTDICGNSEIVTQGENGFLVPFGDDIALCSALKEAFKKKWDAKKISDYAQSRPWSMVADEVINVFKALIPENE